MSAEKYKPSSEEAKKAEAAMTDEQKKLSEAREGGYNIAKAEMGAEKAKEKNPAEPTLEKYPGGSYRVIDPEKPYKDKAVVGGIEIVVNWDDGYKDYVIYFPQLKIGEEARRVGIADQAFRVSRKPEVAKKVFDYAAKLAESEGDLNEIYMKTEAFSERAVRDIEDGE